MMQPLGYLAPRDRSELIARLAEHGHDSRLLAGGTDVIAELRVALHKHPPRYLIDVKRVPGFRDLRFDPERGLSIGPAVTCADLLESTIIRERFQALTLAAGNLGSPQLRNRATAIGNICTASPCADVATALLALGAEVEIESHRGVRTVPLREFFLHVKKTVLARDELVTRVVVPARMAGARAAMEKLKRVKGHDLALVSVVLVEHQGELRGAIASCAPTPVAMPVLDAGSPVEAVVEAARSVIHPIDDLRASAEYRSFMVGVYVERLLGRLIGPGGSAAVAKERA